jgi:hypothetical protein
MSAHALSSLSAHPTRGDRLLLALSAHAEAFVRRRMQRRSSHTHSGAHRATAAIRDGAAESRRDAQSLSAIGILPR